jgi:hypothetical protein
MLVLLGSSRKILSGSKGLGWLLFSWKEGRPRPRDRTKIGSNLGVRCRVLQLRSRNVENFP